MKIRVIYIWNTIPFFFHDAITIYPFIFIKRKMKDNKVLLQHEMIHIEQVKRLGWLRFYITYLWYNFTRGYKKNPFEVEAYARQNEEIDVK
jgi:hypothetical protein